MYSSMNPLQELPASDISSLELLHNLHQSALKEYNFSTAFLTPRRKGVFITRTSFPSSLEEKIEELPLHRYHSDSNLRHVGFPSRGSTILFPFSDPDFCNASLTPLERGLLQHLPFHLESLPASCDVKATISGHLYWSWVLKLTAVERLAKALLLSEHK
jgi:hypothetical protein